MLKKLFILFSFILINACASNNDDASNVLEDEQNNFHKVNLVASQLPLRRSTATLLKKSNININDDALEVVLNETHKIEINSLNSDGTVSTYKISYTLVYKIGEQEEQKVSRYRILDHDEGRFHANEIQREKTLDNLRKAAIKKVIYEIRFNS